MRTIFTLLLLTLSLSLFTACAQEVDEPTESQARDFYAEQWFEAAGFTPAYTYIIAGSLNDEGKITHIHFDMISSRNVSKRSTDYLMNIAHVNIGGEVNHQTLDIFVGGSSANIPQVYNYIRGSLSDINKQFMSFPIFGMMGPYTGEHGSEIFNLIGNALSIELDENTPVIDVIAALGLYHEETETIINTGTGPNRKTLELTGRWGGGSFDRQLLALEQYIVEEGLTLDALYQLLTEVNQADDLERDTVAGATMMFEPKIAQTLAPLINKD